MARDAAAWRWYADVNDSVRHEVVERGWFGREVTDDINSQDMPGMRETEPTPDWSEPEPETADFYGSDAEIEDAEFEELYGKDPEPYQYDFEPEED